MHLSTISQLGWLIGPQNAIMVEEVDWKLPVKFLQTYFNSRRGLVKNVLANESLEWQS